MSTKTFPSNGQVDNEGLPIPKKINLDEDGLPIPTAVKKKDATSNGSPVSPSASTKDKTQTARSNTSSELGSQSDKIPDLAEKKATEIESNLYSEQMKKDLFSPTPYGHDLSKNIQRTEAEKSEVTKNYYNSSLTPENIEFLKGSQDLGGLTPVEVATGINNKTKNLRDGADNSLKASVGNTSKKIKDIQDEINTINGLKSRNAFGQEDAAKRIAPLQQQLDFYKASLQRAYDAEKKPIVDKLKSEIYSKYPNSNAGDLYEDAESKLPDNRSDFQKEVDEVDHSRRKLTADVIPLRGMIEIDKTTHQLSERSTKKILGFADNEVNKTNNKTVNAATTGDADEKKRNYPDIGRDLVNQINNEIYTGYKEKKYNEDFTSKNPQAKPVLNSIEARDKYFSTHNVEAKKAETEATRDKESINISNKYFGQNGILLSNPAYVGIQHKYADRVAKKLMPEDVAMKNMQQEIENSDELKPLYNNYKKELDRNNDKARKEYENFIVAGIRNIDPDAVVYNDGSIGAKGVSKEQAKKISDEYRSGKEKIHDEVSPEQQQGIEAKSNTRAKLNGAFWGSLGQATNDMMGAFHKWWFDKTGYGGDDTRLYQAKELSGDRVDLGAEAQAWEWQGAESLLNPNFYLSQAGKTVPMFAPAAAIGLATGGEGVPAYIGWLASAGIFDFQNALPTYNSLVGSRDKDGNLITEYDASRIMVNQMEKEAVPDAIFMAIQGGVLGRAKTAIVKPTIGRALLQTAKETAIGAIPMTWQGYDSYAAMLEGQGKQANLFDYLQSPEFRTNIIDGMAGGLALNLVHLPERYKTNMNNWTQMIHSSEGEFNNNSLFNSSLQIEANGNGERHRDQLKLSLLNGNFAEGEKGEIENQLLYSTLLKKNIDGAGIDTKDINGLYQAHNLALADLHQKWAEQNEGNKTVASIYASQSKDFEKEARNAMEDKAKFHYLVDNLGQPIFVTDKGLQTLEANGNIKDWFNKGIITDIRASDDPKFGEKYKEQAKVGEKNKELAEGVAAIDKAITDKKIPDTFAAGAKQNPEQFLREVADQAYSITRDPEGKAVRSEHPNAEQAAIDQYGKEVVDAAKKLFPDETEKEKITEEENISSPNIDNNEKENKEIDAGKTDVGQEKENEEKVETNPEGAEKQNKAASKDAVPSVSEIVGKPINYKGEKAIVYQDGQTLVAKIDGTNKEYELGNVNEVGKRSISDFGIEQQQSVVKVDDKGNFTVRDKKYTNPFEERGQNPLDAILYDKDGNVVNVRMKSEDGERRTFTGEAAEDLAYQIHLKEITKDNETRESFEQFINDQPEVRKEIISIGLPEITEEKPVENNAEVSENPEEIKTNVKEQPEIKEAVTEIKPPTINPPKTNDKVLPPEQEWTAIRKEKQNEIDAVKKAYEKQGEKKWTETLDNALQNLQTSHPDKNLYDAALAEMQLIRAGAPSRSFTTDESLAAMQYLKRETESRRNNLYNDFLSGDELIRTGAIAQDNILSEQLNNAALAIKYITTQAGRTLVYAQSELGYDEDHGLQLRRMDLMKEKGDKLNEEELKWTADHWEKEKELMQRENELKQKGMQETFDKQIAKLKKEYDEKLRSVKPTGAKLTVEKQKNVADKLRKWADNFEKLGRADLPEGTQIQGADIQKMVADAMRYVADKIEEGKLKIPDIIADAIAKHANKDLSASELRSEIQKQLLDAGIEKKDALSPKEFAFDNLKENAIITNSKTITQDMVAKNLIRDYVNSHIGETEPTKILDKATEDLKEIFPFITKEQLREAYLKEDNYKVPTEKKLRSDHESSKNKLTKFEKIEKDIYDLKNKKDIYVRDKKLNSAKEVDKQIEAKENELKKEMIERGVKYSGEDKYSKASYNTRAQLHNERLDNLSQKIIDRIEKGNISDTEKNQLLRLKDQLDNSKIKLDENSALSQKNTVDNGLTQLSRVKREFDKNARSSDENLGTFKKQLQGVVDKFQTDKDETEQDAKLARAKDNLKNEISETERKIKAGEFEDKPITALNRSDAELVKLQIARNKLQSDFAKKKTEFQKGNKSWLKKAAEFTRAAEVAFLIGRLSTLAKVAASGLSRPTFEAATKLTGGRLFGSLPFETTKAIYEKAKSGGESTSVKGIRKGYEAQFRQYNAKQLEKLYQDANDKFEKSNEAYNKYKGEVKGMDKDSPEYEKAQKKLQQLNNTRNSDMIDAMGNSIFQYIGGSSVKDAVDVLLHRTSQLEKQFGYIDTDSFDTKNKVSMANLDYLINFIGRSHAAAKNFSGRASFAAAFISRLEGAVHEGVDITKPEKILEIANESELDWNRGKYQESNWVSDHWNKVTNAVDKISPALAFLLRADVAITRVPVNMIYEGVAEYSLGAITGSFKAWQEYAKAKNSVLQMGFSKDEQEQFSSALKSELAKIPPERAADILRAFRKGGFGLGMYALAAFGIMSFGGFPHKGQTAEDKRKVKREQEGGEPELMTGEIKIGDYVVPETVGKIIEHTPALQPALFSLGLHQVYKTNIIEGKTTAQAAANSMYAHVEHIINSIPIIEKFAEPIAAGAVDNLGISKFGQWTDIDENGQPVTRKPLRATDYAKYLTGNKKGELSEKYYKDALKTERYYNDQISEVMTNGTLSKADKEKQRDDLLKQKEADIDSIYEENKNNPE